LTIKFTQRIRTPEVRPRLCNFYSLISLTHRAALRHTSQYSKALIKFTLYFSAL